MSSLDLTKDKGDADPVLIDLLNSKQSTREQVFNYLTTCRLIGAIVAEKKDEVEMMQALFKSNDGRVAMPVFTSLHQLSIWNKDARALPKKMTDFVKSALEQNIDAIIIDISATHRYVIEQHEFFLLLQDEFSLVHQNEKVIEAIQSICKIYPQIKDVIIEQGQDCDLKITLQAQQMKPEVVVEIANLISNHEVIRQKAPRGADLFLSPAL